MKSEVTPLGEEADWVPFGWKPQGNSNTPRPRGRGVAIYARRLMAAERARARRSSTTHFATLFQRRKVRVGGWRKEGG